MKFTLPSSWLLLLKLWQGIHLVNHVSLHTPLILLIMPKNHSYCITMVVFPKKDQPSLLTCYRSHDKTPLVIIIIMKN